MDFSQLPKMSKTPEKAEERAPVDPVDAALAEPAGGAPRERIVYVMPESSPALALGGVWISLICGLICLMVGQNFARWLAARVAGRTFETHVNWADGRPVEYFDLQGFTALSDMGVFLMGVALLLDAGILCAWFAMRSANHFAILFTIALTAIVMLINVYAAARVYSFGTLPITSLIAVLVGGMILFDHAALLKRRS